MQTDHLDNAISFLSVSFNWSVCFALVGTTITVGAEASPETGSGDNAFVTFSDS